MGPISSTQPNQIHRTTDQIQPNASQSKTFVDPQTNPTYNPIELHTTNNKLSGTRKTIFIISQSVKVYKDDQY